MDSSVAINNQLQQGLSLEEARDFIRSYDLTPVVRRLVDTECWSKKHALAACEQYRNFLFLMKKFGGDRELTPSFEIDEAWHAHILHTKKYIDFCEQVFGKYLHHYPHLARHKGNAENLNKLFQHTQNLHKEEFGDSIYQIKHRPIRLKIQFRKIHEFLNSKFTVKKENGAH